MENLFDLEQNIVKAMDNYLKHIVFETEIMELHYKDLSEIESEIQDIDKYVENPVNASSVIKRMHCEATDIQTHVFITLISLTVFLLYQADAHFLSVEDLEEFYDLEQKLATTFTTYIEEQKQILEVVKQRYEEHKQWQPVLNDTDEYLSNPLNVHAMLKRLVSNWPLTLALLEGSFTDEDEEEKSLRLPSVQEYQAAVHGIARIQQVYHYNTKNIISGSAFPGTDNTSVLTADDCLAVGRDFYDSRHYGRAIAWFKEALTLATNQSEGRKVVTANTASELENIVSSLLENIYEYLSLATCFIGDQKQSKKYFNKLYTEFPEFQPTQNLITDHLLAINDTCTKLIDNEALKPMDHKLRLSWREDAELSTTYSELCRATTSPHTPRPLSCRMVDWGEPFWRLQPFKMEDLHRDPLVFMTYNVISPAERQFFMDKMMDENILYLYGFVYEFWQPLPANSTLSESLVRRTERLTGATVHNTSEHTCLASFPPGAEYVIDMDLYNKTKEPDKIRLGATVYYIQEPQAGGLMVFPRLGLSVAPVVGAALTWFDVDKEGKVDERTSYGSCPVLRGHQTTLTLWFKRKEDK